VIHLLKDRGINVEERKVSLAEVASGLAAGEIVEVFACGTAAVITPIGEFKSRKGDYAVSTEPGELTVSLRQELTGIQYGTVEDRHGWMYKLAD
jgi:branched-chain amino acid aminotransferase